MDGSNVSPDAWLGRFAPHLPEPPAPSDSRAGRNLPAAIITGIALLAVVAFSLFVWIDLFVVLAWLFMIGGLREAAGAFQARRIYIPIIPLWLAATAITVFTWVYGDIGLILSFFFSSFIIGAWRIRVGGRWAGRDATAAFFAVAWIAVLGGFAILLAGSQAGPWAVVTFIVLPVANDTGGYATGVLFGKHPIAPTISPKKSWEGFAGSVILSTLVGVACAHWALDISWWWGIILALACTVAATCGDLAESLLKRDLGVKDMGSIFPGHGGVLDRVDSILVCAPVVYLILSLA